MKKIIISLIFLLSTYSVKSEEVESNNIPYLYGSIITYWGSLGVIEGLKWRHEGLSDNPIVFHESYHVYRAVNNAAVISLPIVVYKNSNKKDLIKHIIVANIVGWMLYERLESYTERNELFFDKGSMEFGGLNIPRSNPIEMIGGTILSVCVYKYF